MTIILFFLIYPKSPVISMVTGDFGLAELLNSGDKSGENINIFDDAIKEISELLKRGLAREP